jgi:hypothetical protein
MGITEPARKLDFSPRHLASGSAGMVASVIDRHVIEFKLSRIHRLSRRLLFALVALVLR